MMEKQTVGERYLAGLVMAFAAVYFLAAVSGPLSSPRIFATVPAVLALLLGRHAWLAPSGKSVRYSVTGLFILLSGIAVTRLGLST
jgi:hypothetical protein